MAKSDQQKYQMMIKNNVKNTQNENQANSKLSSRRMGSVDFQKNLDKLNLEDTQLQIKKTPGDN